MRNTFTAGIFLLMLLIQPAIVPAQTTGESRFDSLYTGYFRRNSDGWTAGDATISIPLPDGRVIWLFGDSYTVAVNTTNNTLPCLFQVRNCFMVQDSADPSVFKTILDTTMTGVNTTTFKLRPNDTSIFWPGHGYVYGDTVYIFLERYKNSTLAYEGCYIAKLTYPELHQVGIVAAQQTGPNSIMGRAVIVDSAANRLYIYGNRVNWIIWEPILARVDLSNPLLPWEFFNGTGWDLQLAHAEKICSDPVSPGYSVFPKDGKYYLITQENGYLECGLGREIWSYSGTNPWGPFTGKTLLYTEESKFNDAYLLTYNGQAHPWNTENNELLVSYNVNDRVDTLSPYICPSQCVNIWNDRLDADSYRPKFVRIPMDLVTSAGSNLSTPGWGCPEVRLLQNPISRAGTIAVEISVSRTWRGMTTLRDLSGRVLWSQPAVLKQGANQGQFPAPSFAGIYFLEFAGNAGCGRVVRLVVK